MSERDELLELIRPLWSATRTATALGVDILDLDELCQQGDLLGLTTADGSLLFPVLQFRRHDDGVVRVQPDLAGLIRVLVGQPPWSIAALLVTPAPELEGMSPVDWIRSGRDAEALTRLGDQVRREWR